MDRLLPPQALPPPQGLSSEALSSEALSSEALSTRTRPSQAPSVPTGPGPAQQASSPRSSSARGQSPRAPAGRSSHYPFVIGGRLRAYLELSKPGVTRMVLVTTALGVVAAPGAFRLKALVSALLGTALVVVGANALNMFLERDSDRLMTRTAQRPLPTGRLEPEQALTFGLLTAIAGLFCLAFFSSGLAFSLATLALLSYVLLYTPMKKMSSLSLVVGAVPGALPPAIGYAAVTGTIDGIGLWLFLILLVWQVPHFLAISLFRQTEYERAGLRVLPAECGAPFAKLTAFAMALVLLYTTLIPYAAGLAPASYGIIAGLSGLAFAGWAARGLVGEAGPGWARSLFFSSMPHLVLVMSALVITTR